MGVGKGKEKKPIKNSLLEPLNTPEAEPDWFGKGEKILFGKKSCFCPQFFSSFFLSFGFVNVIICQAFL